MARPYARAAFEYALAASALEDWVLFLSGINQLIEHPAVDFFCKHPQLSVDQKYETLLELGGDLKVGQKNFLKLLIYRHRMQCIGPILLLFKAFKAEYEKILNIDVFAANEMQGIQVEALISRLKQKFNRTITFSMHREPSLIAGLKIQVGSWVVDGSLRGRLQKLSQNLGAMN